MLRSKEDKEKHNIASKRGREKINESIESIKNMLPECRGTECNKLFVLQCAVEKVKYCHEHLNEVLSSIKKLQEENNILQELISRQNNDNFSDDQ